MMVQYLVMLAACGVPLLFMELAVGQYTRWADVPVASLFVEPVEGKFSSFCSQARTYWSAGQAVPPVTGCRRWHRHHLLPPLHLLQRHPCLEPLLSRCLLPGETRKHTTAQNSDLMVQGFRIWTRPNNLIVIDEMTRMTEPNVICDILESSPFWKYSMYWVFSVDDDVMIIKWWHGHMGCVTLALRTFAPPHYKTFVLPSDISSLDICSWTWHDQTIDEAMAMAMVAKLSTRKWQEVPSCAAKWW